MLRSLWLTCVLTVVSTAAWAQSAQPTTSVAATVSVPQAQQSAKAAEQQLVTLTNQRVELRRRYDDQLSTVDRLKKQKASWRRDRELNKAQADANDTAKRLTAIDNAIKLAQQDVGKARTGVVKAIDAELAAGATGARADQLTKLRAQLSPSMPTPKKIVIPDAEIDPLADPEELERQAAALMATEKQLEAQRKGLDQQHKDLKLVAELRSAHERAGELSTRDDDQPHRGAQKSTRSAADESATPAPNDGTGGTGGGAGSGSGAQTGGGTSGDTSIGGDTFGTDKHPASTTFESTAAVALGEVIDKSTIEGMLRASRTGDPKQRAEAARMARDAVAKRLEQLRAKRKHIEDRAKLLRKH
ncbi:MAG TPA: hypothetical protein VIV40_41585 [Kofleriaceae bacterium]